MIKVITVLSEAVNVRIKVYGSATFWCLYNKSQGIIKISFNSWFMGSTDLSVSSFVQLCPICPTFVEVFQSGLKW